MSKGVNLLGPDELREAEGEQSSPTKHLAEWAVARRRILLIFMVTLVAGVLAAIAILGHPFIAVWLSLVLLGWLFLIGAAKASGDP